MQQRVAGRLDLVSQFGGGERRQKPVRFAVGPEGHTVTCHFARVMHPMNLSTLAEASTTSGTNGRSTRMGAARSSRPSVSCFARRQELATQIAFGELERGLQIEGRQSRPHASGEATSA